MSRISDKIAAMKVGALLLLSASSLFAQTPFEIRGTVSEPGLGGIAGVEVRALSDEDLRGGTLSSASSANGLVMRVESAATPNRSTVTDARGQFVIRTNTAGSFAVLAQRDGYSFPAEARYRANLTAAQPQVELQLAMVRRGSVSGRVIDADTRQPLEGLAMRNLDTHAYDLRYELIVESADTSRHKTDRDGNFAYNNILPGDYSAAPMPPMEGQMTSGFTEQDGEVVDDTYVLANSEPKVHLNSGGFASFGDIFVKKAPLYRIHVSLPQGDCPEGESVRVSLLTRGKSIRTAAFVCGSELLIRNVPSGSYFVYAVSDWQGDREHVENTVWGMAPIEVVDKNQAVSIPLQRGIVLEGRLVAGDGLASLPEIVSITTQPDELADGVRPNTEQFTEWGAEGKFRLAVSPRTQTLTAGTQGVFVSQIRYNGSPLPGFQIPVNPGAAAQNLELIMGDKFGTLMGTVLEGERTAPRSLVLLQREGFEGQAPIPADDGTFRSQTLIPGQYRVMAIRRDQGLGTRFELPADAAKITIRPGETININVRVAGASK